MGIRLSPKYGVNPSVNMCFFCGEGKEVLLLGRMKGFKDEGAPRKVCLNYDPCDSCKQKMSLGFVLIEGMENPCVEDQPFIQEYPQIVYPTGSWWVVKKELAIRAFGEEIVNKKRAYISPETAELIGVKGHPDKGF